MPFYPGSVGLAVEENGAGQISPVSLLNFEGGSLSNAGGGQVNYTPPSGGGGLTGTYHDVTSSRALNASYTNNQSVPVYYSIVVDSSQDNSKIYLAVNGVAVDWWTCQQNSQSFGCLQGFANPGDAVELTVNYGSFNIYSWFERY